MVGTSMITAGQVHAEEIAIARLAVALGALEVGGQLSAEEERLATKAHGQRTSFFMEKAVG